MSSSGSPSVAWSSIAARCTAGSSASCRCSRTPRGHIDTPSAQNGASTRPTPDLQGTWTYIYRAIDQHGQVVDAYFSTRRNAAAAEAFFRRAIDETGSTPTRVTTDKAKCYPPALRVVLPTVEHRTSKYLNNGLERDHQHLKQRLYPMRGFKQASVGRSPRSRPRVHPKPAQRLLHAHRHSATAPAPHDRVVAADPGDLARAAAPITSRFLEYSAFPASCPRSRNRTRNPRRAMRRMASSYGGCHWNGQMERPDCCTKLHGSSSLLRGNVGTSQHREKHIVCTHRPRNV